MIIYKATVARISFLFILLPWFAFTLAPRSAWSGIEARTGWNDVHTPKKDKTYPNLSAGFVEAIQSLSLCRKNGACISEQGRGLVIMLGGTGAKPSDYGVLAAMSETASFLVNRNWDVWGIENPLYRNYDRVQEKADQRDVEEFSKLSQQMNWLYSTLTFILSQIPEERIKEGYPILVFARSTGTGLVAEGLHRYLTGDPQAQVLSRLSHVLMSGVVGHLEREIGVWDAAERGHPSADPVIQPVGVSLFREMSWAQEGVASILSRPETAAHVSPHVSAIVGAFDGFQPAAMQEEIYRRFFANHSGLAGRIYTLPTGHNPAAFARYELKDESGIATGAIEKRNSMYYLGPVFEELLLKRPEAARVELIEHPDTRRYLRLLTKCEAELIQERKRLSDGQR